MKMGFLFSGVFWGGVLVLLGISIIIKVAFHIDIPVFRIVVALVLIYIGVRLLCGSLGLCRTGPHRARCGAPFHPHAETRVSPDGSSRFHKTVFGENEVDLTDVKLKDRDVGATVEVIFGSADIVYDPDIPTEFAVEAAFGNVSVPGFADVNFGSRVFANDAVKQGKPRLRVSAKAVFGNVEFKERKRRK